MRRKKAWLSMLTGMMVGGLLFPNLFGDVARANGSTITATVKSVVDGDTIHLKEKVFGSYKVRFLNIDTPETKFSGHSQEPWGTDAAEFLLSLIPPGTKVTIITDEVVKDHYGRLLAHIKKGDLDINRELLRQGYAGMYYIWPNMKYFSSYREALLEAISEKRGIWNPHNALPEEPFEFRFRVRNGYKGTDKFVGDFSTKMYVDPKEYHQIPTQNRVFFWSAREAEDAGYTKEMVKSRLAS